MDDDPKLSYEEYGHAFTHGEWMQLMIHYYRGEMNRATVWRQRLDVTTNWAVAASAAMMTFMLGSASVPHTAILLPVALNLIMLNIEARRYLYYDLWRSRLRMLERGLIAPALWRPVAQREIEHEADWRRKLAEDMYRARFHMPFAEAWGRRLQRNYTWLMLLCYVAWILKLATCPDPATCPGDLLTHAAIGALPGWAVLAIGTLLIITSFALGPILTRHRRARGEALPFQNEDESERWGIV